MTTSIFHVHVRCAAINVIFATPFIPVAFNIAQGFRLEPALGPVKDVSVVTPL